MAARGASIGWLGLLLLVGVVAAALYAGIEQGRSRTAARHAFPLPAGELRVAGLRDTVTLLRDAAGVPHVLAAEKRDAWVGLGFAHAQDRLAQMLWLVRLARGTSAEIAGPETLAADRHARTLGLGRLADTEWEALRGEARALLEAYAEGVNARIERIRSGEAEAPVAVRELGLPLAPWAPADSLAILKLHAWSLASSVDASLVLHDLLALLGGVDAKPFFPGDDAALPNVPGTPLTAGAWRDPLRAALGLAGASAGSTAFVVAGAHTASGRPMLGADIHVEPTVPLLLHVAHVRAGALDVAGAMIPGLPLVWSGHNRRVAWGATHARAVVTDLYTERVEFEEARYHDGRRWRSLEVWEETIAVRGAEPVTHTVRATHHGPLLEALGDGREPLALGWVGQRGQGGATLAAWLTAAQSENAAAFHAALAGVAEPAVAVVYADYEGAGGAQVAGWIPERRLASGLVPVQGRARWFDWVGPIAYERLPGARLDEESIVLVAADNPQPGRGAARGEWLWRSGTRARRLEKVLATELARGPLDLDGVEALQADVGEPRSQALSLAALTLVHGQTLGGEAAEVAELLEGWDGAAEAASVGAAAHHAFTHALLRRVFAERMGEELFERWLALPHADPAGVLHALIERSRSGGGDLWSEPEGVALAVHGALRDAWLQLSSQLGASRRKWAWGRLHRLRFRPFLPARQLDVLGEFAAGGSGVTLATAEFAPAAPFGVSLASLFRLAVDTAAFGTARVVIAPGQSEHPGHRDHASGIDPWRQGRGLPLETEVDALGASAVSRLQLEPAP